MIVHDVGELVQFQDKLVLWKDEAGLQAAPFGGYETRQGSVLSLVEQADREFDVDAFGPLLIHTNDKPISTADNTWRSYAFCTAVGYLDVAVPDFVFDSWPQVGIDDFDDTCRELAAVGTQPAERPVVGWIGACDSHPIRSELLRLGSNHPELLDIHQVEWVRGSSQTRLSTHAGNQLSLPEQVARWGALIDVEGVGYSGRLKMLLHSGRPVLVQDRPWREWFWDELVPMEHYVPVRRDLSDLVDRARWVQDHPEEALRIAQAGQRLAQRLLTRSGAVEQWARTLGLAAQSPPGPWASHSMEEAMTPVLCRLGLPQRAGTPGG